MTTLNIRIPEHLKAALDARAAGAGFPTTEAYVEDLLRADAAQAAAADDIDYGAPDHLRVRSREDIERLVSERAQGSKREMTAADWADLRRRLEEQHARPMPE